MESSATRRSGTFSLVAELEQRLQRLQIKARIAEARERAGLTQPELGDLMHPPVHWRTVQEWEGQKNDNVPFRQLERIAEVTNSSTLWLLHGRDEGAADATEARSDLVGRLEVAVSALADEAERLAVIADRLEAQERARAGGETSG